MQLQDESSTNISIKLYVDGYVNINIIDCNSNIAFDEQVRPGPEDSVQQYSIKIKASTLLAFIKERIAKEVSMQYPDDSVQMDESVVKNTDKIMIPALEDFNSMSAKNE